MNTAPVIQFPKPQQEQQEASRGMYSDRFKKGYVMSSRLYREEVYPFISDAARNVYAELENRINGHNKESDFVSYSQLQGGELEGSRKLSRETVGNGIKELLNLGVITAIATGKRGMKTYRLNEISLLNQFGNRTSSPTEPVHKANQNQFGNRTKTSSVIELTIDNKNSLDNKKKKLPVDNLDSEMFGSSVEYHQDNKKIYTLRELANQYTVKSDFITQAQKQNSQLTDELILAELKNFVQWSTTREKTTAQGWMNYWIYRIQKLSTPKPKTTAKAKTSPGTKNLTDPQINMFSRKLCALPDFACTYANAGESQKNFESRIAVKLRDPENLKHWASYLRDVGFIGNVEGKA